MKKTNNSPYRTLGLDKIEAPSKSKKSSAKGTKITSSSDLRAGGKK